VRTPDFVHLSLLQGKRNANAATPVLQVPYAQTWQPVQEIMVVRNPGLGLGKTEGNDELAIWRNLSTNTAVDYFPAQRLTKPCRAVRL